MSQRRCPHKRAVISVWANLQIDRHCRPVAAYFPRLRARHSMAVPGKLVVSLRSCEDFTSGRNRQNRRVLFSKTGTPVSRTKLSLARNSFTPSRCAAALIERPRTYENRTQPAAPSSLAIPAVSCVWLSRILLKDQKSNRSIFSLLNVNGTPSKMLSPWISRFPRRPALSVVSPGLSVPWASASAA